MTRPTEALLGWVRGAALPVDIDPRFVLSALEHRVGGLLASEVLEDPKNFDPAAVRLTAGADMGSRAANAKLYDLAYQLVAALDDAGVDSTVLKGIGVEGCWYDRVGERPTSDLDLLVWTDGPEAVATVVRTIDPEYPYASTVARLVAAGELQSVDLTVGAQRVDLHFDPLKLGVWTRRPDEFQRTQQQFGDSEGVPLSTFGPECTLVELVMHLNKDSFAFLGSMVDVARVLDASTIDWDFVHALVDVNGLRVPFWKSLGLISQTLRLEIGVDAPRLSPSRERVWSRTWSPGHVLLGNEGRLRAPKRQRMLSSTITGRPRDVTREVTRRMFPTSDLYVVQGIKPKRFRWLRAAADSARAAR